MRAKNYNPQTLNVNKNRGTFRSLRTLFLMCILMTGFSVMSYAAPATLVFVNGQTQTMQMCQGGVADFSSLLTTTVTTSETITWTITSSTVTGTVTNSFSPNTLTGTNETPPANSFTYTPPASFFGSGQITVSASAPGATTATTVITITVNPTPGNITGPSSVCRGQTIALTDAGGGVWSSGTPSLATVDPSTGVVTGAGNANVFGVSPTVTITYSLAGCPTSKVITVNPLSPITGVHDLCAYSGTETVADATLFGAWSSVQAPVSTGGVITAQGDGPASVSYTTPLGCIATATFTVNPLPNPIVPATDSVCVGSVVTLSETTTGGAWSSSNTGLALVDGSGNVTGVSAGTPNIIYTLPTTCFTTAAVTVNPLPSTITANSACLGQTITLPGETPSGGTWSSNSTAISITPSGDVTGLSTGTGNVTYTTISGCMGTGSVTVNPLPANITGTTTICQGQSVTLSDATTPGSWTSDNGSVAIIDAASGLLTGEGGGTANITYTLPTNCYATTVVTVNAIDVITGPSHVCIGSSITLNDASANGTWTSSNANVTIDPTTGVMTGVDSGLTTITYSTPSCFATATERVDSLPLLIGGSVCVGGVVALTHSPTGGRWSSSDPTIATINRFSFAGNVHGVSAGTDIISYRIRSTGCISTVSVIVNPISPIDGANTACAGTTIQLSDAAAGGTWSSDNTLVAAVDANTGLVTAGNVIATSNANITYTTTAGCTASINITVNPNPGPISGTTKTCEGQTTNLFDNATPGGLWSSNNPNIATVDGSGLVTGVLAGLDTIVYTVPGTGCFTTTSLTVNPKGEISGILFACNGTTTTLFQTQPGLWSIDPLSPIPHTANIDPNTGVVTGNSNVGITVIDFQTSQGCVTTTTVTVGSLPPITGSTTTVCAKSMISFRDTVAGGVWSSSNTSMATVDNNGNVTGVSAGNPTISYTLVSGCFATIGITVNPVPVISAGHTVCQNSTENLSEPGGGLWSSKNTSIAIIDPIFGVVFGVAPGMDTVTYTFFGTGCASTATVVVNPVPAPITGDMILCPGVSTTLSDATPNGTWSSTNGNVTIDPNTGVATGQSAPGSFISYTLPTGCAAVTAMVVTNTLVTPITGPGQVCIGQSITLADLATGGTWSSSSNAIGSVDPASGVVTGISTGTTIITYTMGANCSAIHPVQVDDLSPIIGANAVCIGSTIPLSDSTFGGSWVSQSPLVASVDPTTGVVSGLSAGTANIDYILPTGCTSVLTVTVNALPTAISGIGSGVCLNSVTTLSDGLAGGTWSSSNSSIATIDMVSGMVTGLMPGVVTITYSVPSGCQAATASFTVNPLPTMTSSLNPGSICNNTLVNYNPTSDLDPNVIYQWQRNPVTGISNPLNTGSGNPDTNPAEVLNNTTTDPVAVQYAYVLYVNGTGCVAYDTVTIIVNPTPMLYYPLANGPICDSSVFTYVDSSATVGTTYSWTRDTIAGNHAASGSGTVGAIADTMSEMLVNTTNAPVTVSYVVTLTANGCSNTQTVTVVVNPLPTLSNSLIAGTVCDSTAFSYTAVPAVTGSTFSWSRPAIGTNPAVSGTGATINDTVVNNTNHPIVVSYYDTVSANGCSNVVIITDTVEPKPTFDAALNRPAICDSTLFSFDITSTSGGADDTVTWTRAYIAGIGLLANSGTGNPNEYLVNTTNDDVTVTYIFTIRTTHGCENTQRVRVVVHPRPTLAPPTGPFSVCSGSAFEYQPTSYVTTGTTFTWSRDRVPHISPATGSGSLGAHGTIIETLTDSLLTPVDVVYEIVMTANGCSDSAGVLVQVNPSYSVPAMTTHPASNTYCMHTLLQNFGVATPAPAGVQYTWSARNATVWAEGHPNQYALISFDSAAGPAVITVSSNVTGVACVSSTVYNATVTSSRSEDIQIIYYNGQFMCLQNQEDSYQWGYDDALTLDSTIVTGETNETYFNSAPDLTYRHYWVMTTHNGCSQKSFYNEPAGVNNVNDDITDVKIYPNPANDVINVDINTKAGGQLEVEVLDVLGQKINSVAAVNHKATINVANLAAGVYLIETYRDGVKINAARFVKN